MAIRLRSDPALPRFGIRDGGNNSGSAGRLGTSGIGASKRQPSSPRRHARAVARAALIFSAGSPARRTERQAAAIDVIALPSPPPALYPRQR